VCAVESPPTTGGKLLGLCGGAAFFVFLCWVVCIFLRLEGSAASILPGSSGCVFGQVVDRGPQNHSPLLQAWPMRQTSAHAVSPAYSLFVLPWPAVEGSEGEDFRLSFPEGSLGSCFLDIVHLAYHFG